MNHGCPVIEAEDRLISTLDGYSCRRITSQNVARFGYDRVVDLLEAHPQAATIASDLKRSYYANALIGAAAPRSRSAQIKECERPECIQTFKMIPRSRRFCSKRCSAMSQTPRRHSEKTKLAISESVKKDHAANPRRAEPTKYEYERSPTKCGNCGSIKSYLARKEPCRTCRKRQNPRPYYPYPERPHVPKPRLLGPFTRPCVSCGARVTPITRSYCNACLDGPRVYRSRCAFRFNVYDWPAEFDIALIRKHGWYRPSHSKKGANLTGVSRDHLFSIGNGYREDRDPMILAHPANCRIMIHNGPDGNNAKKTNGISWDDLSRRIEEWNARNGVYCAVG